MINEQTNCLEENWGPEPQFSDRSRLFRLPIDGQGTPDQESLLSLIIRTARAHSISPQHLIADVFVQEDPAIGKLMYSEFFRRQSGTINGIGPYAKRFSCAMEKLTGHSSLASSTLLPWANLLPSTGQALLSQHPRWCPVCLLLKAEQSPEISFPLLWSIQVIDHCAHHQCALADRCPHCSRHQPFLPHYPDSTCCFKCKRFLGGARSPLDIPASRAWVSEALADMMISASDRTLQPSMERFNAFLNGQIKAVAHGNRAELCRSLGLPPQGMNAWLLKGQRIGLPQFLTLCYGLRIMPSDIFRGDVIPQEGYTPRQLTTKIQPRKANPRLTQDQKRKVEHSLKEYLASSQSMALGKIAKELGLGIVCLRYWFPDLCRQIVQRHQQTIHERATRYRALQESRVKDLVRLHWRNGTFPSARRLGPLLLQEKMVLAESNLKQAYREARLELADAERTIIRLTFG